MPTHQSCFPVSKICGFYHKCIILVLTLLILERATKCSGVQVGDGHLNCGDNQIGPFYLERLLLDQ